MRPSNSSDARMEMCFSNVASERAGDSFFGEQATAAMMRRKDIFFIVERLGKNCQFQIVLTNPFLITRY